MVELGWALTKYITIPAITIVVCLYGIYKFNEWGKGKTRNRKHLLKCRCYFFMGGIVIVQQNNTR